MLNLEKVGIEFSGNWLLREASHQFTPGERVGLIGRNGTGKSTLLRVIVGELTPSEGRVNRSSDLKIAFFNQDLLSFETDEPIFEVVKEAFAPLLSWERRSITCSSGLSREPQTPNYGTSLLTSRLPLKPGEAVGSKPR
jgi:ATP-binding cassette subfamily F protein 3